MKIPDLQGCVILRPQSSMTSYLGWSESPWRSSDINLDRASVLGLVFPPNRIGDQSVAYIAMPEFEYEKINLNYIPRGGDDIDLLDDLGEDGWELVAITANNIAYLKRQVAYAKKPRMRSAATTPAPAASQR